MKTRTVVLGAGFGGRLCATCVLPEIKPHIVLDADGVCTICRDHQQQERTPPVFPSLALASCTSQKASPPTPVMWG